MTSPTHATSRAGSAFSFGRLTTEELDIPLFFIIAIGAGAFTLGATAVDVTSDVNAQRRDQAAQAQQVQYQTMEQCQQAAAQQGLPATTCQPQKS